MSKSKSKSKSRQPVPTAPIAPWVRIAVGAAFLLGAALVFDRDVQPADLSPGAVNTPTPDTIMRWMVATAVVATVLAVLASVSRWRAAARHRIADTIARETHTDPRRMRVRITRWGRPGNRPVAGRARYAPTFDDTEGSKDRARVERAIVRKVGPSVVEWDTGRDRVHWRPAASRPGQQAEAPKVSRARGNVEAAITGIIRGEVMFQWEPADGDPDRVTITYPPTFPDTSAEARQGVVERMNAKAPGRWRAEWDSEANRVVLTRRPQMPAIVPHPLPVDVSDTWRLPVGVDEGGDVVHWDIDSMPHGLVVGTTGGGKTVLLSGLVVEALARGFEVVLVDGKGTALAGFRDWPGVVRVGLGEPDDMAAAMTWAEDLMRARYREVRQTGRDAATFQPVLVVLDEAAEFATQVARWHSEQGRRGSKTAPALDAWRSVARLGREGHVHLVVGIQQAAAGFFGGTEALALDTPVPTPTGWTTMGAIKAGDWVFGDAGRPVRVLAANPVQYDRQCYRVTFSDGSRVTADADHLWLASDALTRRSGNAYAGRVRDGWEPARGAYPRREPQVVTTGHIRDTLRRERGGGRTENWSVHLARPVDLPPATALPVDPWLLGYWLGAGYNGGAVVATADQEVLDRIEALGYRTRHYTAYNYGIRQGTQPTSLKAALREAGVLGNKHVPIEYLRGSEEQRAALLAGLLDSDGHASWPDGRPAPQVGFTNCNRALIDAVAELVASLGMIPHVNQRDRVTEQGANSICYGSALRTTWITFTPTRQVFGISRKRKVIEGVEGATTHGSAKMNNRRIVAVEPVPTGPVRCIRVDAPDSLFLVTRAYIPTHNSREQLPARFGAGRLHQQGAVMAFGRSDVGRDIPPSAQGRATVEIDDRGPVETQVYWTPAPLADGSIPPAHAATLGPWLEAARAAHPEPEPEPPAPAPVLWEWVPVRRLAADLAADCGIEVEIEQDGVPTTARLVGVCDAGEGVVEIECVGDGGPVIVAQDASEPVRRRIIQGPRQSS